MYILDWVVMKEDSTIILGEKEKKNNLTIYSFINSVISSFRHRS